MMYSSTKEKYIQKNSKLMADCKEVITTTNAPCTPAAYVTETLRATFEFIKDHPYKINDKLANASIVLSVSILSDQSSTDPVYNYATLTVNGVVKTVYETYAELEYINGSGEKIESTISYDDIVYVYHISIEENFQDYVNKINSLPPVCYCIEDSKFDLLVKLAKAIFKDGDESRGIKFVLGGVLTREFEAKNVAILRNLVVVEERFVNPITAIGSFIKLGKCN